MKARPAAALAVSLTLALTGLTACSSGPKPDSAVSAYLKGWSVGDLAGAAKQTDSPAAAESALAAAAKALGATAIKATRGKITTKDHRGTAHFTATWTIVGLASPWTYDGQLALIQRKDTWLVHWDSHDIHPRLAAGQRLSLRRSLPDRASILDRSGAPLFSQTATVTVGIEPRSVTDLPALARSLAAALKIDPAAIIADVGKAKPTEFVPVITLRMADYAKVRPAIHELPGTVFRTGQQVLAPSPHFAQPLLGRVGEATADVLKEAGPAYRAGDQLGLVGLQRALNSQLTGTATGEVSLIDAKGQPAGSLATIAGSAGRPAKLTLDRRIQEVADSALATVPLPAAIVAVRPSTGELLAVANSPSAPFDIALAGKYPAGSTFKVITVTAALTARVVQPASTVSCPATVTIGGRTIPNEDRFVLGSVPLRTAFAQSCNTTFATLGVTVSPAAFAQAASSYGIGAGWRLPVTSFSGSVPPPTGDSPSQVERAFDAIGQGQVLVSPLAEALMSATVQHGSVPAPSLIAGQPAKAEAGAPASPRTDVIATLREFTRAVVTEGTATLLAGVPGGPVAGKTGTAEFGTTTPPQAHSWFTGYRGDLAFAVFVYGGQTGGSLANPIARDFLTRLPQ